MGRRTDTPECEPLSLREREVLALVASGFTDVEAGTELGIARATVAMHMSTVMMKLHATHRAHAVVLALRSGQLDLAEVA